MIAGLTLGTELRRFHRSTLGRIALIAISLIPLMYSALYLWAFWDPFGEVDKLPIAFVNSDKGATVDGAPFNAGDGVVDKLKQNTEVHFDYVSKQEALDGVKDGKYYFVVELPEDFSAAVVSPTTDNPHKAVIETIYNDANGYLSTLIGQNVLRTMVPVISNEIGTQAIDKVLVGIESAGDGLTKASDGAGKLHDGSVRLRDGLVDADAGAARLSDGLTTLDDKVGQLQQGAGQLADGTRQLASKVDEATGKLTQMTHGVDQLAGGINQLADGATAINNGVQQLKNQTDQVGAAQAGVSGDLHRIAAQLRTLPDPNAHRLADQIDQAARTVDMSALGPDSPLTAKIHELAAGTGQMAYQLADPHAPFRSGFDQLHAGTGQLPGQLGQLTDGVNRLNDGAHQLADGASRLKTEGTQPLAEGGAKLTVGLDELLDGSVKLEAGLDELSTKLADGAGQTPQWTTAQREQVAEVLGGPVRMVNTNEAGNNTFGAGLAPFFFSLAMFIGGLIIFLLLQPLQNRAVASGVAPLRAALDGFLPGALIATFQATAIVAVTLWGVGLQASYPVALWAFCVLVSIMFTAVNQFLNVLLGPGPGKVAAMALLMLQILSSGGLYPTETEPKIFTWLHPINPMTYSVDGFRQLIYGNLDERLPQSIIAVLIVIALSISLTALGAWRDRTWTMKRLHPPIKL
ncbi:YhgE/Pip family protein [Corynebacterium mendelii]|uniref:YhgE/Pip domain-containing protein n=1 Tax=Corynebacterium mendelii TaxID=2765362 RepID=A0A939IYK6_9CORY|nr:YhgE/Pip domain-containing protein [Corynebacterium mendelii]MBN9645218.1 YhgE/Pip domain-containing protein [Corynebacterium mendelii]